MGGNIESILCAASPSVKANNLSISGVGHEKKKKTVERKLRSVRLSPKNIIFTSCTPKELLADILRIMKDRKKDTHQGFALLIGRGREHFAYSEETRDKL